MYAQPQEYVEKHDMQSKIECMTARETYEALECRFCAEGKIVCKKEVANKADYITCNISYIGYGEIQ